MPGLIPGQCQAPFLRPLSDAEVVAHLWAGPSGHGVLERILEAAGTAVWERKSSKSRSTPGGGGGDAAPVGVQEERKALAELRVTLETKPASAAGARKGLEEVSRKLRALGRDTHPLFGST